MTRRPEKLKQHKILKNAVSNFFKRGTGVGMIKKSPDNILSREHD